MDIGVVWPGANQELSSATTEGNEQADKVRLFHIRVHQVLRLKSRSGIRQ